MLVAKQLETFHFQISHKKLTAVLYSVSVLEAGNIELLLLVIQNIKATLSGLFFFFLD